MTRVLLTAFDGYDCWQSNASWICLQAVTRNLPSEPALVTRRYPVDFAEVRKRLEQDLLGNFDIALFLGQAPGSSRVRFESIAVNVGLEPNQSPDDARPLADDGPVAYRSTLPLSEWAGQLRQRGIPASISHHAGTYLCNAVFYWGQYLGERMGLATQFAFIHLPLDASQVADAARDQPFMPVEMTAFAIRHVLEELKQPARRETARTLA